MPRNVFSRARFAHCHDDAVGVQTTEMYGRYISIWLGLEPNSRSRSSCVIRARVQRTTLFSFLPTKGGGEASRDLHVAPFHRMPTSRVRMHPLRPPKGGRCRGKEHEHFPSEHVRCVLSSSPRAPPHPHARPSKTRLAKALRLALPPIRVAVSLPRPLPW